MADEVEWEYREENLAGAYLSQAVQASLDTMRPARLYPPTKGTKRSSEGLVRDDLLRMMNAASRRLDFARTSILFSALAAEAYVNEFLLRQAGHAGLAKKDVEGLDKLSTPEKYVLGPRAVLGRAVFGRGRQPIQDIRDLFKLRNLLVHPKARRVKVRKNHLFDVPGFEDYNPEAAARFLVAVATAAVALSNATDPPGPVDSTATGVIELSDELLSLTRDAGSQLPPVPRVRLKARTIPKIPSTGTGPAPAGEDNDASQRS